MSILGSVLEKMATECGRRISELMLGQLLRGTFISSWLSLNIPVVAMAPGVPAVAAKFQRI